MKRLAFLVAGLALLGGIAAGCSKTADVATPNIATGGVNTDKITADATKCADMAAKYTQLFTPLATGGSATDLDNVQKQIDDMKSQVPGNIQTDLTTIGNGIKEAKTPTAVMTFMSTPDFTKANTEVTTYLTTQCSKVGS